MATAILKGERVEVLLLDPPYAYGRQAYVRHRDGSVDRVLTSDLVVITPTRRHISSRLGQVIARRQYEGV